MTDDHPPIDPSEGALDSALDPATERAWRLHNPALPENPDRRELAKSLRRDSIPRALRRAAFAGGATKIGVDGQEIGLRQLHGHVESLASALADKGVDASRPTLLAAPNSLDFIRCYLALLAVRSPVVLADPDATGPELDARISQAGVTQAITGGPATDTVAGIAAASDLIHWPRERLDRFGSGTLAHSDLPWPDDVAVYAFTSGTTGEPKPAALRHGDIGASIRSAMGAWRWRWADVLVHALPMHHLHGLSALHAAILGGTSLYCLSRFDPELLVAEAKRWDGSVIFAVPTMWEQIVATHDTLDMPSLRLAISGSAPLPPALFERISEVAGMAPMERYGTTESGLNLSNLHDGKRLPGGVGYPLPGIEIAIDETTSELSVRGPQLFAGYAGEAPHGTNEWFATGDLAEQDPDSGAVTITGRSKEIIITGGLNVHPREVEGVLAEHPAIDEVAVVGVPSRRWGEEVTAFVVSAGGFDEEALGAWSAERLSGYKIPKRFHPIEELPRTGTGKLRRPELVARATALHQGAGDA